ncbi:MAG: alpha-E domain-containing protein [Methylococcaceae bacterium]|jgi:uncharacterized alpha-E superfamily protein
MLSRSAERLYWLARYLERTENIARLVSVHMNLLLDLPKGAEMNWQQLLKINSSEKAFFAAHNQANERNVVRFLLTDSQYSSSLFSSLSYARENIRTTRDLLPDEAWEQVNEMYLYAKKNLDTVVSRRHRVLFLGEILKGCQRFTGLLSGYMNHSKPYQFIRLGRNIERADMTSRILDLASLLLSDSRSEEVRQYESILWINILKSLNALLNFRQQMQSRINGDDVLNFLLFNENLPRAICCCINEIDDCTYKLPHHANVVEQIEMLETYTKSIDTVNTTQIQLHEILDSLQNKLGNLHEKIAETWFLAELQSSVQTA